MGQKQSVDRKKEVKGFDGRRKSVSRPKEAKTIFDHVDQQQQSIFSSLPIEIAEEIFSYFPDENLATCRLVCKGWNLCVIRSEVSRFSKGFRWKFYMTVGELLDYTKSHPQLTVLNLIGMTSLKPKVLKNILEKVPNLQKLYLTDCSPASDYIETIHSSCPKLELLSIMKTPVVMNQINLFSNLRTLVFSYYGFAPQPENAVVDSDEGVRIDLPNLTDLSMELASGSIVPTFRLPKLQALDVSRFYSEAARGIHGVTFESVFSKLQDLKRITLNQLSVQNEHFSLVASHLNLVSLEIYGGRGLPIPKIIFDNCRRLRKVCLGGFSSDHPFILDLPELVSLGLDNMKMQSLSILSEKLDQLSIICCSDLTKLTCETKVLYSLTIQMSPVYQQSLNTILEDNQSLRFFDLTLHSELNMQTLIKRMKGLRRLIFSREAEGESLYEALAQYSSTCAFELLHIKSSKRLQSSSVEYLCSNVKVSKMRISGIYSWLDDTDAVNELLAKYPFLRFNV